MASPLSRPSREKRGASLRSTPIYTPTSTNFDTLRKLGGSSALCHAGLPNGLPAGRRRGAAFVVPATAWAEGAQLNAPPFPATASAEGAQLNAPPSLFAVVNADGDDGVGNDRAVAPALVGPLHTA